METKEQKEKLDDYLPKWRKLSPEEKENTIKRITEAAKNRHNSENAYIVEKVRNIFEELNELYEILMKE